MLMVLKLTFKIVERNLIIIEKSTEKINDNKNITKLSHKNIAVMKILAYFHLSSASFIFLVFIQL